MKKLASVFLALVMMLSAVPVASAATIDELTGYIDNPLDLSLDVSVGARVSNSGGVFSYPESREIQVQLDSSNSARVDYESKLDMSTIRALFDGNVISYILPNDADAMDEFRRGTITTEIEVTIEYPVEAQISADLNTAGTLYAGSIFREASRVLGSNSLVIKYVTDPIPVGDLQDNIESYPADHADNWLKDISFVLNDSVTYNTAKKHKVDVKLNGYSSIQFDSKTQRVNYSGIDSITIDAITSGGGFVGGGGSVTHTVTLNLNGGTGSDSVKVESGKILDIPEVYREGYILEGWYTDAEFTNKYDFSKPVKSNITLYANWVDEALVGKDCEGTDGVGCASHPFSDVNTELWYHFGCDYVIEYGLMIGVAPGVFAPNKNITRGMIVTVLGRKEGIKDDDPAEATYNDVILSEYYASHIDWADENGIVLGYGDGNFGPDDSITREQMAAIIYRYLTYKGVKFEGEMKPLPYVDADQIQAYAVEAVNFCYNMGIMIGKDENVFDPRGNATRAEFATLMRRTFKDNKA